MGFLGLTAALMAQKGYTGDMEILDGEEGYWKMAGSQSCNWDLMTGELGKKWWIGETSIKCFPACGNSSHSIDLFSRIIEKERLSPDDIEEVTIGMPFFTTYLKESVYPKNLVDAQFSIPYSLTMLAHKVKRGYRWFTSETMNDPKVVAFFRKIRMVENRAGFVSMIEEIQQKGRYIKLPTFVEVKVRGRVFRESCEFTKGDPWTPETRLTDEEVKEKFRDLCSDILPSGKVEGALDRIFALEQISDVSTIIPCLVLK
jgi:2-methylcitrate dehydratase PrpD